MTSDTDLEDGDYDSELENDDSRSEPRDPQQKRAFPMIKLVRELSNLSPHFRQELGNVLWAKTKICVRGDASMGSAPLAFFIDRPGISYGIQSLHIDISCKRRHISNTGYFDLMCRHFSNVLQLASLHIGVLGVDQSILYRTEMMEALCRGEKEFSGLWMIRLIKSNKPSKLNFRTHIRLLSDEPAII